MSNVGGVGKVGVIRIKSFSGTTADTVKGAYEELKKKGVQAFLTIDVRGNPGGLLPGGVDTVSLFLSENKPAVFVVDKKGIVDSQATFGPGIDLESPLVVLVNGNMASAAEVFTAARKENGRAVIAGKQTFGKGIVQTIRELSNENGGVAITVARYETPKHNDINKQGIPVNVTTSVECPKMWMLRRAYHPRFSKSRKHRQQGTNVIDLKLLITVALARQQRLSSLYSLHRRRILSYCSRCKSS